MSSLTLSQRVASILTCLQVVVTSANQTNPSSRPHMCIMRCGSCSLKPAVTLVSGEVVHHHHLPRSQGRCQNMFQVGLKNLPRGRAFDRQARAHPPSTLMLASKVTFFPQLRGTLA